jgi:hypothetical protein
VSTLTIAADSSIPGATTAVDVSFNNTATLLAGTSLYFYFDTATYTDTLNTAYDLSTATLNSETVLGSLTIDSRGIAAVQLTADLPTGPHSFTLQNVTHPAESYYFVTLRLSGSPSAAVANSGAYINSADFDAVPTDASDNTLADQLLEQTSEQLAGTTPTNLKVKKLKRRSAILRWSEVEHATFYKVQLRKKNNAVVKTFKHVTVTKKNLAKQWLKAGKKYKFRVKACNTATCSNFSDDKKFTTKD